MTPPAFPPGRYGRRRERPPVRGWVVAALAAGTLAVMVGLAVVAYRNQNGGVQAAVTGFTVGPRAVQVTFEVHRPANRPVRCLLRARDAGGAEVGRAQVPVPPGPGSVTLTYTLPTRSRAVTGEVYGCTTGSG